MARWRHEYRWSREWAEPDEQGHLRPCAELVVVDGIDHAIEEHEADADGGWVTPGMHQPRISELTRWIVTRRIPRSPTRAPFWTAKEDIQIRPAVDLDTPDAVQPPLPADDQEHARG